MALFVDRVSVRTRAMQLVGVMVTISSATASIAADKPEATTVEENPGWIVTLGAGTEYGPTFEGSGDNDFSFVPNFDIRRANEPAGLSAPDDNIDFSLIELGGVELGPVASIRGNRSKSDVPGVHEIDWSVDVGAFGQYWLIDNRLRVRAEARQGVQSDDGFVADFAVDWFQPFGDKFLLSAGPRASFADATYMENSFAGLVRPSPAIDEKRPAHFMRNALHCYAGRSTRIGVSANPGAFAMSALSASITRAAARRLMTVLIGTTRTSATSG